MAGAVVEVVERRARGRQVGAEFAVVSTLNHITEERERKMGLKAHQVISRVQLTGLSRSKALVS